MLEAGHDSDARQDGSPAGSRGLTKDLCGGIQTTSAIAAAVSPAREREKGFGLAARAACARASPPMPGRSIPEPYGGLAAKRATLRLSDGALAACHPLVRTIATPKDGLTGRSDRSWPRTPEEFSGACPAISGRIVLVRHD